MLMQTLSKEIEKRIEDIVSVRFYNQITPYDVIRWLFNFDDEDVELAVQLLEHVIFLRDDDVKGRLYDQIVKLPRDRKKHIVPLGKPGKSGAAVSYWIHGLMKRNELRGMAFHSSFEDFISYRNSQKWETQNDVVVYVDDFIGSGGSVVTALSSLDKKEVRPEVLSDAYSGRLYVVAAVVMDNGYSKITKDISGAVILGDSHCKGFDPHKKVYGSYFKTKAVREMCYKYGEQLYKGWPLGYENTQSLVLMQHSSPNNTIPVLWSDNQYQGRNWNPLVPRNNLLKIKRAYTDRTSVYRWLSCLKKIFVGGSEYVDFGLLFTKSNFNLVFILICLIRRKSEAFIYNTMGISLVEMDRLWQEGIDKKIWDSKHKPTSLALNEYKDAIKRYKLLREEGMQEFRIWDEKDNIYIPETFRGVK